MNIKIDRFELELGFGLLFVSVPRFGEVYWNVVNIPWVAQRIGNQR